VNLALSYPSTPKSINYDLNPLLAEAEVQEDQDKDKEGDYQENHIHIHLASSRNITLI
jgi:hypothetical protein